MWVVTREALQQSFGPEAIIAGGALRDTVMGQPVKDVDIFLPYERSSYFDKQHYSIEACFEEAGVSVKTHNVRKGYRELATTVPNIKKYAPHKGGYSTNSIHNPGIGNLEIKECWEIESQAGHLYNLVFTKHPVQPKDLLQQCDIGLCRIAYQNDDVIIDNSFTDDAVNQTLTLFSMDNKNHIKRIKKKYPDHQLVNKAPTPKPNKKNY